MTAPTLREPRQIVATQDHQPTAWIRWAVGLGGVLCFGLLMGFGSLLSNSPAPTDTRQQVWTYLAQHHDRLQLAAVLYALAMPAALLFLAGLFGALRIAEGGRSRLAVATVAGGVLAAAMTVTGALVLGVTATRYADMGPAQARVFWTMFLMSYAAALAGQALMIGSAAVISLRTGLFARWFTFASLALAVACAVGVLTIGYITIGIEAVTAGSVIFVGVWIAVATLRLVRHPIPAKP